MKTGEIALISAMSENRVIGRNNQLLWRLPEDMRHFVRMTIGHPVIMGRKTFESLGRRPLPNRRNIVLTRDRSFTAKGAETASSAQEALALADGAVRICVIGGGEIYKEFMPYANAMYLTRIHHIWEGDAVFPEWSEEDWQLVYAKDGPYNVANPYHYTFEEYRRR